MNIKGTSGVVFAGLLSHSYPTLSPFRVSPLGYSFLGTGDWTRTSTVRFLRPFPLPCLRLGYTGKLAGLPGLEPGSRDLEFRILPEVDPNFRRSDRIRTCLVLVPNQVPLHFGITSMVRVAGIEPALHGLSSR